MKTISIKQPWAWLIASGVKNIENRTWKCPEKYIGQRILIHASQTKAGIAYANILSDEQIKAGLLSKITVPSFDKLQTSAIIGSVEIVDCVINHHSVWAEKSNWYNRTDPNGLPAKYGSKHKDKKNNPTYNWVLANPILFDNQIDNVKGKLSFWDYESEDFEECTSCDKKFPMEIMEDDSAGNWFCPECWKELAPVMAAEHEELKATGEVD